MLGLVANFEDCVEPWPNDQGDEADKGEGSPQGQPPKLRSRQEAHLVQVFEAGEHTTTEIAELMGVSRSMVYRAETSAPGPATPTVNEATPPSASRLPWDVPPGARQGSAAQRVELPGQCRQRETATSRKPALPTRSKRSNGGRTGGSFMRCIVLKTVVSA